MKRKFNEVRHLDGVAGMLLTKLDAARRQLGTAIELWFTDGDPVSIHTLAFAAHEIIHVLSEKTGESVIFYSIRSPLRTNIRVIGIKLSESMRIFSSMLIGITIPVSNLILGLLKCSYCSQYLD